jgi:hypothetical protein
MQLSIFTFLAAATLSLISATPAPGIYPIKPRLMPNATTIISTQTVTTTVTATAPVPTIPVPCTVCLVFESTCIGFCIAGAFFDPLCDACVGAQMEIMIECMKVSFCAPKDANNGLMNGSVSRRMGDKVQEAWEPVMEEPVW